MLSLVLAATVAQAGQIDPQQAQAIASQFISSSKMLKSSGDSSASMQLAYTATAQDDNSKNMLYVVNRGSDEGYVVVAGDDAAPNMVLGYTDNGSFDYDNAPDNLKWWLAEYVRQLEFITANGITAEEQVAPASFDTSVEPMVTTLWDQGSPYNDQCNGYYTGCVATAMAQVMNFHEWPKQGTGKKTYYDSYSGKRLTADFGSTTYQWDLMLDTYDSSSSAESCEAVATLMFHCGVSVEMAYMADASGAYSYDAAAALMEYFGYPDNVQIIHRDYRTYDEWVSTIKGEIDAARPVLLGGQSTDGGHEFVIDGYNTDGYFHVNWGWSGQSNGYYLLATLNPYEGQGIGSGSSSGFKYMQDAIINVQPPVGDETPLYEIDADEVVSSVSTAKVGESAGITLSSVINYGCQEVSINFGAMITDENGEEISSTFEDSRYTATSYSYIVYYSTHTVTYDIPADLADGTYRVYPIYRHYSDNTLTGRIHISQLSNQYVAMSVTDGIATFSNASTTYDQLTADNIIVVENSSFTSGSTSTIQVDITNNGEETFSGLLSFALLYQDSDDFAYYGTYYNYYTGFSDDFDVYTIDAGETQSVKMSLTISNFSADDDYYRVVVINNNYDIIGTPQLVKTNNPSITCTGNPQVESSDNVDANDIRASVTLRNQSSTDSYEGNVRALIYSNGKQTAILDTQAITIEADGTTDVYFAGEFPDAVAGNTYTLYIYNCANGSLLVPYYATFTVGTAHSSSVENVIASTTVRIFPNPVTNTLNISASGTPIEEVTIYSLSGTKVAAANGNGDATVQIDMTGLAAGTYLVRIASATGSSIEKVIKK